MGLFEIFMIAIALSMDAFAVSVCAGLSERAAGIKHMVTAGLYFGIAQAVMPIIGYFLAASFSEHIIAYGNVIGFVLLAFLGGKMVWGSFAKGKEESDEMPSAHSKMIVFAIATSIDALAVGISFAFLTVNIFTAALLIGITTFVLSMVGVRVGCAFGARFKSKAEFLGGVILVVMGVHILLS